MRAAPARCCVALGIASLIERFVGLQSVSLVFLMAVLASAIAWGLWPALFACLLSVLAFNFFFLPPLYTSPSPTPKTSSRCSFSRWSRWSSATSPRRRAPRSCRLVPAPRRRPNFTRSAASLPGSARSTISYGRPPSRSRRCSRSAPSCYFPDQEARASRSPPPTRPTTRSTKPTWRRRVGAGNTTIPRDAVPTRCPAASGCSCRCGQVAARSA